MTKDEHFQKLIPVPCSPLGLRVMAAEPKRGIPVSHQPDFSVQLAVGYVLGPAMLT